MSDSISIEVTAKQRIVTLGTPARLATLSSRAVETLLRATDPDGFRSERVLTIRSANKAFCAGFDLKEGEIHVNAENRFLRIQRVLDQIREAPVVTVALVNGAAVGAGADLALSCDYGIGTENASLRFPGSRFGVILGTDHLARTAGALSALDIVLRNRRLDSEAAHSLNLLTHVLSAAELDGFVQDLIADMADLPLETVAQIVRAIRSDDRSRHVERLRESLSHPAFADRLATFASSTMTDQPAR